MAPRPSTTFIWTPSGTVVEMRYVELYRLLTGIQPVDDRTETPNQRLRPPEPTSFGHPNQQLRSLIRLYLGRFRFCFLQSSRYFRFPIRKASARLTSDFIPFRFPESFERSNKNKCLAANLSTMALVSGGRSTLNPNAPLFIPASFRQVEDFSPQWWELVKTSKWFHDYWLNQHQEQEIFEGNDYEDEDIANLLPESFDLGIADEFSSYLEDCAQSAEQTANFGEKKEIIFSAGLEIDTEALVKNLSLKSPKGGVRSPAEPAKYREKPGQSMSPKCSPRRIQQPR
ncbi:protein EARLY RESPONSIVE TO DEHYDRATION 15 isoform X1 [Cinnamomum micranthum f. kanehirae]|uniref:Protein EARLY RESPONSIVE TO DEHYDRATION 15 isoform X1 n=1 Tax=Cinnamomum micranthum f. kanehirae TaxID=337451 RepID=A0A443NMV6_9MAGN|nr:protein EARLY RESPONSIVE TO DEHYDRATION 15 isoform X1 [Cinnamomum micranthum f. kanehirae]